MHHPRLSAATGIYIIRAVINDSYSGIKLASHPLAHVPMNNAHFMHVIDRGHDLSDVSARFGLVESLAGVDAFEEVASAAIFHHQVVTVLGFHHLKIVAASSDFLHDAVHTQTKYLLH
jgi:hypothetical protein